MVNSFQDAMLLMTARVKLIIDSDRQISVCALSNSALEASFITERVARQLLLNRRKINVAVSGLQGINIGRPIHAVSLTIVTTHPSRILSTAFILPNLASFKRKQ